MTQEDNVKLINSFPDPKQGRFDKDQWLSDHGQSNVIINCFSKQIYYPDHWTPLSMKCAFNGNEFYRCGNATQCASDNKFLIYNQGKEYTSFIESDNDVESFTINFSELFVNNVTNGLFSTADSNLDDPFAIKSHTKFIFFERANGYTPLLRQRIFTIRDLIKKFDQNKEYINELLYGLLEDIILFHKKINLEVNELYAIKESTRIEIYKRLYLAKDMLDASFHTNITLDILGKVSMLNSFYLLRLFKSYFKITPHQYLKQRRIEEATKLLKKKTHSVKQVCNLVGFSDISSFSKLFKRQTGYSPAIFSACNTDKKV